MVYEANSLGMVKGLGEVFEVYAPLDEQIRTFTEVGITAPYLATPEQVAIIRIAGVSQDPSRTSMAPVSARGKPTILIKDSPIMNFLTARLAVNAHKKGEHLIFPGEIYEAAEELAKTQEGMAPEDRTAHRQSFRGDGELTARMDDTRFILGSFTEAYFKTIRRKRISLYGLTEDLPRGKAAVGYLWFSDPSNAEIYCGAKGLEYDKAKAFAILMSSGVADKRKISGYTLTRVGQVINQTVRRTCEEQGISGLVQLISPIREKVLEELRTGKT